MEFISKRHKNPKFSSNFDMILHKEEDNVGAGFKLTQFYVQLGL